MFFFLERSKGANWRLDAPAVKYCRREVRKRERKTESPHFYNKNNTEADVQKAYSDRDVRLAGGFFLGLLPRGCSSQLLPPPGLRGLVNEPGECSFMSRCSLGLCRARWLGPSTPKEAHKRGRTHSGPSPDPPTCSITAPQEMVSGADTHPNQNPCPNNGQTQ